MKCNSFAAALLMAGAAASCTSSDENNMLTNIEILEVDETQGAEKGVEAGVSACFAGNIDGTLIRAGGCNFPENPMGADSRKKFYSGIYALDFDGDTVKSRRIGTLPCPMAYGASVQLNDGVALIGGTSDSCALKTAFIMRADGLGGIKFHPLPDLPATVDNMAAALIGERIYVAGGNVAGEPSNALFCLDLSAPAARWEILPPFPGSPRVQPVMASAGGSLYLWGGFAGKGDKRPASLETDGLRFDTATSTWHRLAAPQDSAGTVFSTGGGTATAIPTGEIVVTGGVNKDIFLEALQNQAPDYLSHPAEWYRFNRCIAVYNPADGTWRSLAESDYTARAGATAVLSANGKSVIITGGELKPRIRTPRITRITFNEK